MMQVNSRSSEDSDHFPIRSDLARRARLGAIVIPGGVAALIATYVGLRGIGWRDDPIALQVIGYGMLAWTFAIIGLMGWLAWRKAPREVPTAGLTVSDVSVTADFGRGPRTVPLDRIGSVIPVRFREHQKPAAILLAPPSITELGRRDRNRVLAKAKEGGARLHAFKGSTILPLRYFGEDQADLIVAAIERRRTGLRHDA
jgi:hypothetical protein